MKIALNARNNISKFFYDCGKVTFTVLVIGALAKRPSIIQDICLGAIYTAILFGTGVLVDHVKVKENEL